MMKYSDIRNRRMKFGKILFGITLLILFYNIPVFTGQSTIQKPAVMENSFKSAKAGALNWLKKQIVPNDTVPEPSGIRRNFILSYDIKDRTGGRKYLYGKSSLYDNALAVIAFTMSGEMDLSETVLTAVFKNMRPDNNLWFSYNTHNEWPDQNDSDGAVVRTGASAWFGYAAVFYLESVKASGRINEKKTVCNSILNDTEKLASAIIQLQIKKRHDLRYGFVTGGDNQYRILCNDKTKSPEETFEKGKIEWISTEHNIDTYFFLKSLYNLTGNEIYNNTSEVIGRSLLNNWNGGIRQLIRGRSRTSLDFTESLDCASWGSMFLRSSGDIRKAEAALTSCSSYLSRSEGRAGYRPYRNLLVYEDRFINSMIYPDNPDKNWNDIPMLWHEGSLGVAMAYLKASRYAEAEAIIREVIAFQCDDGGVPYSNIPVQYQFSSDASAASTAWLVMAVSALEDEQTRNIFWR